MTLKDKIQKAHSGKISDYSKIYTPTAEVIEQIADEYAIEFAYWLLTEKDETKTLRELLEIFKKEKQL